LRCTLRAERRAIYGLLQTLQHLAANADFGLLRADIFDLEDPVGVEIAEGVTQLIAALWDGTYSAPFAIADLENVIDQVLGNQVAFPPYHPRVLVLNLPLAELELAHRHEYPFKNVQRLESGDDYGNTKSLGNRLVFSITHYGANVSWPQKPLHPIERRLQN